MKHGDALEPTLGGHSDEDKSPFATPLPREGRGLRQLSSTRIS